MGREIAARVGCSEQTVVAWRARYANQGLAGLDDRGRSGRPPTIDATKRSQILAMTLKPLPEKLGVTYSRHGCWPVRSVWIIQQLFGFDNIRD
jgi:transposase